MFMAQVDGNVSPREKELYRAMLSRMTFEEHTPADFQGLVGMSKAFSMPSRKLKMSNCKKF
jgi:hypothetical protein